MHSNIRLQELDKELEKRKLPYVRYADDISVYTKSNPAVRKVGNQVYLFLQEKLKLPINREKSDIRKPVQFGLLGYQFVPTYKKGDIGRYQLVAMDKFGRTWKESSNRPPVKPVR